MIKRTVFLVTGSLLATSQLLAQTNPSPDGGQSETSAAETPSQADSNNAIVVTGIRSSLQKAADVKRNAVQVVDSIVAPGYRQAPRPDHRRRPATRTGHSGLDRSRQRAEQRQHPRIDRHHDDARWPRGVHHHRTGFDLKDVPAEALARVDVYKSQTSDLIEGGVAGAIDLQLSKPFDFKKPTFVFNLRTIIPRACARAAPSSAPCSPTSSIPGSARSAC